MTKRHFTTTVKREVVPSAFRGWAKWSEGDRVVGVYHSCYESEYEGKMHKNYRIKILETNFDIETKDAVLEAPCEGEMLVLNSAGQLCKFMEGVQIGMAVEVEYGGKKQGNKPGDKKKYHTFTTLEAGQLETEEDGL